MNKAVKLGIAYFTYILYMTIGKIKMQLTFENINEIHNTYSFGFIV